MLHILLLILKIIGIILLSVLCILFLAIGMVFFVPLRYRVTATADGTLASTQAEGRFSWLLHVFSGRFTYKNGELQSDVHVLWKKLKFKKKEAPKKEKKERKKKTFLEKIKYTIQKICDMIKTCREKRESVVEFIADEVHLSAWKRLKQELLRFLKIVHPRHIEAQVHFGMEDPSLTGQILAVLSILYPFYGDRVQITPDFEQEIFEGQVLCKGKVRGVNAFVIAWRLFFDKDIQTTIKDIQKWKN